MDRTPMRTSCLWMKIFVRRSTECGKGNAEALWGRECVLGGSRAPRGARAASAPSEKRVVERENAKWPPDFVPSFMSRTLMNDCV